MIAKFEAMDAAGLAALIAEKEADRAAAEKEFTDEVEKLQAEYERMQKEKEETQKAVKDSGLGLMKSVLKYLEKRGCDVKTYDACSDKQIEYVKKMVAKGGHEAEAERLTKMLDGKMKPDQKAWLNERIALLRKLIAEA